MAEQQEYCNTEMELLQMCNLAGEQDDVPENLRKVNIMPLKKEKKVKII